MNSKTIEEHYQKLLKKKNGCSLHKMDLHIHTPASKCYKSALSEEEEYIQILEKLKENNISIAAITDHNSVKGFFKLKQILKENKMLREQYKEILLLPGMEISNFGKHILAIFPDIKTQDELNNFLYNIGVEIAEQGDEFADAYKVTPVMLLEEIDKFGGLAILAHADASNGLLEKLIHKGKKSNEESTNQQGIDIGWIQNGKSLAQVIKSPYLKGISINKKEIKQELVKNILNNKEYRQEKSIAILYCSDSHATDYSQKKVDGAGIGTRFSYIKLSYLSFAGLKLALEDSEVRIYENDDSTEIPYIEGVAVKGGYLGSDASYEVFRFNKELNCIIGARGTGKSTLLDIIQYTLSPKESLNDVIERFSSAIVYLKYMNCTYAIACEPRVYRDSYTGKIVDQKLESQAYRINGNGRFTTNRGESKKLLGEVAQFSSVSYRQKDIYQYTQDDDGPIAILDNLLFTISREEYIGEIQEISLWKKKLEDNLKRLNYREFKDFLDSNAPYDNEYLEEIIKPYSMVMSSLSKLRVLRRDLIEKINSILTGKVILNLIPMWDSESYINELLERCRYQNNIVYEKRIELRDLLRKMSRTAKKENKWHMWIHILKADTKLLVDEFHITQEQAEDVIKQLRRYIDTEVILSFSTDKLEFLYNVNEGLANKERLVERSKLSMGQRAVAMLLVILKAGYELGDNRPLIIDQPEDDLDNVYIYSTLVKEFREIKKSRQLIFATHNSNIPIAGDAENIMIMESDGEHGKLMQQGSIDKESMRSMVLKILEGGDKALLLRLSKYESILNQN